MMAGPDRSNAGVLRDKPPQLPSSGRALTSAVRTAQFTERVRGRFRRRPPTSTLPATKTQELVRFGEFSGAITQVGLGQINQQNQFQHQLDLKANIDSPFIVSVASSSLTDERVATDTATIAWDFATASAAKASIVAASVGTTQLANSGVTYAKIQNVSATDLILGRSTAGAGVVEEIACTAAARTVLDDATVGAMVDTLGGAAATGTGGLVRTTSPTLVTPTVGVATATSINKVVITAPATSATLTIAEGSTLTASATSTVSGTNTGDQTITLTGDVTGSGTGSFAASISGSVLTTAARTVTDDVTVAAMVNTLGGATSTGSGGLARANGPTFTNPVLGDATATTINKVTITDPGESATLTIATGATLTVSANATVSGTNTGNQTITLTGPVTGSGTGSFATTITAPIATATLATGSADATKFVRGDQTWARPAPLRVSILSQSFDIELTNHPSTAQFLNAGSARLIRRADLAQYSQVKMHVRVTAGSASANSPRLLAKFRTTFSTTVGDYTNLGASAAEVSCSLTSTGCITSGWVNMHASAKIDDCFLAIVEIGGDGVADPYICSVDLEFR